MTAPHPFIDQALPPLALALILLIHATPPLCVRRSPPSLVIIVCLHRLLLLHLLARLPFLCLAFFLPPMQNKIPQPLPRSPPIKAQPYRLEGHIPWRSRCLE